MYFVNYWTGQAVRLSLDWSAVTHAQSQMFSFTFAKFALVIHKCKFLKKRLVHSFTMIWTRALCMRDSCNATFDILLTKKYHIISTTFRGTAQNHIGTVHLFLLLCYVAVFSRFPYFLCVYVCHTIVISKVQS